MWSDDCLQSKLGEAREVRKYLEDQDNKRCPKIKKDGREDQRTST